MGRTDDVNLSETPSSFRGKSLKCIWVSWMRAIIGSLSCTCVNAAEVVWCSETKSSLTGKSAVEETCWRKRSALAVVITISALCLSILLIWRQLDWREIARGRNVDRSGEIEEGANRVAVIEQGTQTEEVQPREKRTRRSVFVTPKGKRFHLTRNCIGLARAQLGVFARDPCRICGDDQEDWA